METLTNTLEKINKGRWQWQSNADPWSKTEKPKWESYPHDHNYLIEKAYYDQQKEVDLGDYLVYPFDFVQKKKGNPQAQRSIRRVDWTEDEQMNDRSARYFETELPKTINRIFGGLGDFISFFSRRNQEILDFTSHFKEVEKSNNLDILNHKITPELVHSLEEALLKPLEEQVQDSSLSLFKKKMLFKAKEKVKELISVFGKSFSTFEEFYEQILRAYTMDTGLYIGLNQYLRNESWMEIDKLLPYAFCLCKVFFHLKLKPGKMSEFCEEQNSIILYRGTSFDEFALNFYDTKNIQYFSWNSVTSTTTNKKMAEEFMYKSVEIKNKKDPVMFIIEIPMTNNLMQSEKYLRWINIQNYSAIPKEEEVIFAPGSVFELLEVSTDQDKRTTIKIKMMNEIQSLTHRGLMMQGTLQSQMATEKEAKVMCLEGEELDQALVSLRGNKLIEELEFCLCIFGKKLLSKMFEVLPTLEKANKLKFVACMIQDNGEITLEGCQKGEKCEITKIEVVEANNFFQIICNEKHNQGYWVLLRELDLDFRSRRSLKDEELDRVVSQGLKYLPQLQSLNINFEDCEQITDDGVKHLAKALSSLFQLTHLSLDFRWCKQITNAGVDILAQKLNSLTQVTDLDLNFLWCKQITDEAMNILAQKLSSLTQLRHFNFHFEWRKQIKDKGTSSLTKLLSSLAQLIYLSLEVYCRQEIAEEMNCLVKGLDSLTKLTHFDLNFSRCEQIANDSMSNFAKGLDSLTKLTHLNLNFRSCSKITDGGVDSLTQGLNSLPQLTHLDLDFGWCNEITDDGVNHLAKGIGSLTQLAQLNLNFESCHQITNKGVSALMSQGLKNLTRLTSLILDFESCQQVTDQDLHILTQKWLKHLISLESLIIKNKRLQNPDTPRKYPFVIERVKLVRKKSHEEKVYEETSHLQITPIGSELSQQSGKLPAQDPIHPLVSTSKENKDTIEDKASTSQISEMINEFHLSKILAFNFQECCSFMPDEFPHNLSSQVEDFIGVGSLTLTFPEWCQITDSPDGLKPLKNVTSLKLEFSDCEITNKGVTDQAWEGLKHLSQLKFLALGFRGYLGTTNEGIVSLVRHGLKHLSQLEALALNSNWEITDKGVDCFVSEGLQYLTQLKFLGLDFAETAITDSQVNNLILHIVKNIPQLTFLDLNFDDCRNFSDSARSNIIKVLHYFGFTQEVDCQTPLDWFLGL